MNGSLILGLFFIVASSIWLSRNKKFFDGEILNMSSTIYHAISMLHVFKGVKTKSGSALNSSCAWNAPPENLLKLNVDGATFHHLHKAGIGVVLRDKAGKVLMATSKGEREVAEPEMIEFLAVLRGLQFVMSMGISHLIIESDCLLVVSQLNDPESVTLSPWGSIIASIRSLLVSFMDVQICHVNRLGNGLAHELARHEWEIESIRMWWEGFPDFISQAIWFDSRL